MRIGIAALALASALGCSYDFNNPAEKLHSGQVLGRAVGDVSGGGVLSPIAGVSVALENDPFAQVTRPNGRFVLLTMPTGRHTVLFRKGTTWALQRDVDVGFGRDGQIEGVNLGDVRLRYTVELRGTFTLPPGFAPVAASPSSSPFAVEDEITGATAGLAQGSTSSEVTYSFLGLPVGPHRIRVGAQGLLAGVPATFVGLRAITVADGDEGKAVSIAGIPLAQAPGGGLGHLQGRVAVVAPREIAPSSVVVELHDSSAPTDPFLVTSATLVTSVMPDSTGFWDVQVASSAYRVRIVPPVIPVVGGEQPIFLEAPPLRLGVVVDGQATDLGTLYAVDSISGSSASFACFDSSDCAPAGTCTGGFCTSYSPPPAQGPAVPFCLPDNVNSCGTGCPGFGIPCAFAGGTTVGFCGGGGASPRVCVPAGAQFCTTDGVKSFDSSSGCL